MDTPTLGTLMGAYFHQDWADEGDEEGIVRLFLGEQPGSFEIVPEIDQVLTTMPNEEDVKRYVLGLGACYVPGADEGGYRGWLASIAAQAREFERGGAAS